MKQYLLSICIPNYNRLEALVQLVRECVRQIEAYSLQNRVELCISDDCSVEDPTEFIMELKKEKKEIAVTYRRNKVNLGMDGNFLNAVRCAQGSYCWIIGNDDLPEDGSLMALNEVLEDSEKDNVAVIVSPLDAYNKMTLEKLEIFPLGKGQKERIFDTAKKSDRDALYYSVENDCALFGFLSNVIFRKKDWDNHEAMFQDKMDTVFIQIYMNIQTLSEGGKYFYLPIKLIKNYWEPECSLELHYKIAIGLYDVLEYFFHGTEYREFLVEKIVSDFVVGRFWEHRWDLEWLQPVFQMKLKKVDAYNRYYIPQEAQKRLLKGKKGYVFGVGLVGSESCKALEEVRADIQGVLDNNPKLWGTKYGNYPILSPECLKKWKDPELSFIAIASGRYAGEIALQLEKAGYQDRLVIVS